MVPLLAEKGNLDNYEDHALFFYRSVTQMFHCDLK